MPATLLRFITVFHEYPRVLFGAVVLVFVDAPTHREYKTVFFAEPVAKSIEVPLAVPSVLPHIHERLMMRPPVLGSFGPICYESQFFLCFQ